MSDLVPLHGFPVGSPWATAQRQPSSSITRGCMDHCPRGAFARAAPHGGHCGAALGHCPVEPRSRQDTPSRCDLGRSLRGHSTERPGCKTACFPRRRRGELHELEREVDPRSKHRNGRSETGSRFPLPSYGAHSPLTRDTLEPSARGGLGLQLSRLKGLRGSVHRRATRRILRGRRHYCTCRLPGNPRGHPS